MIKPNPTRSMKTVRKTRRSGFVPIFFESFSLNFSCLESVSGDVKLCHPKIEQILSAPAGEAIHASQGSDEGTDLTAEKADFDERLTLRRKLLFGLFAPDCGN